MSRALGITAARASQWRDQFLAAGQAGLKSRAPDARDDDHRRLQAKIGELLMETELLYAKVDQLEAGGPLARAEVDAMSGAQSISTRRAYGVQRVCRVWHCARSSVYARRQATPSRRRVVAAVRSAPSQMTSWWPTFVGCSKPRRFMARATEKCGPPLRPGPPRGRDPQTPLQPTRTATFKHATGRPDGLIFLRHSGLVLVRP